VRAEYRALGAAAGIAILAACSSGQSAIQPPSTAVSVQNTTALQFRVGTARHADGNVYFNTLVTYRQGNGLSGTLYNTPSITGPAGFVVPAAQTASTTVGSQPGVDAGTHSITATPPTQPGTPATATTFNQTGGAFAYGFAPANSTTSGAANYAQMPAANLGASFNSAIYGDATSTITTGPGAGNTQNNIAGGGGRYINVYTQPLYLTPSRRLPFLLGPPVTPDIHNPNAGYPSGFLGYDSGFTYFAVAPVAGTYTMNMTVPSNTGGNVAATFTTTASLTSVAGLPVEPTPVTTETAVSANACGTGVPGGGASIVVAPGPAGVTNQVLYVVDVSATTGLPTHYAFNIAAAGGTATLSATSGPGGKVPFCSGDSVYAWVVGADYDIVGLAPPGNTQQTPSLPAQADITVSPVYEIAY
jgi:hypothetical protein